ncbi:MAG TPA: hypothetical protein VGM39_06735 [Kofleriaceae bacterium]|jgi:hypothetical protein
MLACVVLAACGDANPTISHLDGSPDAVRAVVTGPSGDTLAIGGESAFGLASLQREDGGGWSNADGVPAFDAHAKLFSHGEHYYALSATQLYVLNGDAWQANPLPTGVTADTEFGVDDDGRVYGLELDTDGGGAVLSLMPGDNRWTELPGSRPIGVDATSFVVEGAGTVTWTAPDTGLITVVDGVRSTAVDCNTNAHLGGCGTELVVYGEDNGTYLVLACNETKQAMMVLSDAEPDREREDPVPGDNRTCRSFGANSDGGRPIVATYDADGNDAKLYWYTGSWNKLDADAGLFYAYGGDDLYGWSEMPIGDAPRGIYEVSFP